MAVLLAAPFIKSWSGAAGRLVQRLRRGDSGRRLGRGAGGRHLTVALFRSHRPRSGRGSRRRSSPPSSAHLRDRIADRRDSLVRPLSYFTFLKSDLLVSLVPAIERVVWPARRAGRYDALAAC